MHYLEFRGIPLAVGLSPVALVTVSLVKYKVLKLHSCRFESCNMLLSFSVVSTAALDSWHRGIHHGMSSVFNQPASDKLV